MLWMYGGLVLFIAGVLALIISIVLYYRRIARMEAKLEGLVPQITTLLGKIETEHKRVLGLYEKTQNLIGPHTIQTLQLAQAMRRETMAFIKGLTGKDMQLPEEVPVPAHLQGLKEERTAHFEGAVPDPAGPMI